MGVTSPLWVTCCGWLSTLRSRVGEGQEGGRGGRRRGIDMGDDESHKPLLGHLL